MYQDHFGLQRHLFEEGIAQGIDVFLGAPQKLAVTNLGVALTLRDSVAVLTGSAGVGKTTLVAHTLRSLTTRLALGWLGTAPATGHELLEMLLTEFGFSPYKNSRVERLQMWRQYLSEMRATDTRVCVLVESAENFQPDVLAALESLTAADPNGGPGANVVLTSRAGLGLLAEPAIAALKQRTRLRWSLEPLTRVELRDYLTHCITAAGGKTLKLFTDDALDALHQYSGGIIRTANNLCATALTLAASAREPQVSAPLVTQVAVDVFGLSPLELATTPAAPRAESVWPAVRNDPTPAAVRSEPTPAAVRPEPTPAAVRAEPIPAALRAEPSPVAVRVEPKPAALRTEPSPAPLRVEPSPVPPRAEPSAAVASPAASTTPTLTPGAAPRAVAPPPVVPTPTPPAAPAPSIPPSHALAAKVAATRAAQAASVPAPWPTSVTKPAPPASPKPAMAQAQAPVAAPPSPPAQAPSSAKTAVPASTPVTAGARATAPASTLSQVPPMPVSPTASAPRNSSNPASVLDRPAATPSRLSAPPSPAPVTRSNAKPPNAGGKPAPDVPVLTVEFESSPEVADEEFSFDLALSAGQIDAVLAKDLGDVPILTDSVEPVGEEFDGSMRIEFDEETQHKLANLEALANAKALEDISNSMAETLFGDAELDKLAATLALATGKRTDDDEDDEPSRPATARTGF